MSRHPGADFLPGVTVTANLPVLKRHGSRGLSPENPSAKGGQSSIGFQNEAGGGIDSDFAWIGVCGGGGQECPEKWRESSAQRLWGTGKKASTGCVIRTGRNHSNGGVWGNILVPRRNRNQAKSLETWPGGLAATARAFSLLRGDQPIIHSETNRFVSFPVTMSTRHGNTRGHVSVPVLGPRVGHTKEYEWALPSEEDTYEAHTRDGTSHEEPRDAATRQMTSVTITHSVEVT